MSFLGIPTLPDSHGLITAAWVTINTIPFIFIALVWFGLGSTFWGLVLLVFYPLYFVPFGFFIAMPLMTKLFRKAASPHRR